MRCFDNIQKKSLRDELNEVVENHLRQTGLNNDYEVSLALKNITQDAIKARIKNKKQQLEALTALGDITDKIDSHMAQTGKDHRGWGAIGTIESDPYGIITNNYSDNKQAYLRILYGTWGKHLDQLRATWTEDFVAAFKTNAGKRTLNAEVKKILSGKHSDNDIAHNIVKAWRDVAVDAHARLKAAGLPVGEIPDYKLQNFDWETLFEGGKAIERDEFINFLFPKIDRTKKNPLTQQLWTDAELRKALGTYYQTLINGGRKLDETGGGPTGGLQVANGHSRIFYYKDEFYDEIMTRFGHEDQIAKMISYIDGVASDLAEVRTWSVKPETVKRGIIRHLNKHGDDGAVKWFNNELDVALGRNPAGRSERTIAKWGAAARAVASAYQLGRAPIAAFIGDVKNVWIKSIQNDSSFWQFFDVSIKNMGNTKAQYEFLADQHLLVDSTYNSLKNALFKFGQSDAAQNFVSDRMGKVLQMGGLGAITENRRAAYEIALQGSLGRRLKQGWSELSKPFRASLEQSGITEADWLVVQSKGKLVDYQGMVTTHKILDFASLKNDAPDVFEKFVVYRTAQSRQGVIVFNVHAQAMMQHHLNPGSFAGEAARIGSQYMLYSTAFYYNTFKPLLVNQGIDPVTKGKLAAALATSGLASGLMVEWARDLLSGKSPAPLVKEDGAVNWALAERVLMRSDIIPIFGAATLHVLDRGPAEFFEWMTGEDEYTPGMSGAEGLLRATPVTSLAYDKFMKLMYNPTVDLLEGEDASEVGSQWARHSVDTVGTIFGANNWHLQWLWRKAVLDNIEYAIDPDEYEERKAVRERYLEKDGQVDILDYINNNM